MLVEKGNHEHAETRLAERSAQLDLAGKIARIGNFTYDHATQRVQLSPGCAVIYGLPEGSLEISRENWRALVDPDDLRRLDAITRRALTNCETEVALEFRIMRHGEVRWIESRALILYNEVGQAFRRIGIQVDVTDRKRAEDTLHQRETELIEAQRLARIGSWHWDAQSDVSLGSEELLRIFGLDPTTLRLPAYREQRGRWYPVEDWKRLKAAIQSTMQTGVSYELELQAFRTGTPIWIIARGAVVRNSMDRIVGLRGTVQEITERKLAELALAERDAQLALAAKAACVGCYANNLKTGLIAISEGYAAIHALPEGTLQTTLNDWRPRVHPDDLARFDELREQIFGIRQRDYTFDYRLVRADGGVRWIESRGCVSYDEDGQPEQCIGINIDVTARKQTETRLSDALAVGRVVAFEWDAVTSRSQRSGNAERILGISQNGGFLKQVHPADRRNFGALIRNLSPSNPSYALTFRFAPSDSSTVWLEEQARGEFDASGKLLRIRGLTRDITERKELEDHKSTLIAELDHRVRNVLATVSAIASRTKETAGSRTEFVDALDGRIKSMSITHELLGARHWQGIALSELLHRELAPYATASNTHFDGPDILLRAEAGQALAMVFHELATNSAKFGALSAESGRVSVRWSLRCAERAERWLSLRWEESGGPLVVQPTRCGFGTSVIRDLVPYELGGTVELAHLPEGICCNLQIPAPWFSASAR